MTHVHLPPKSLPLFAAVLAVVAAACAGPDDAPSKEEFRNRGKADLGFDFCEAFGWYGDGICDGFCPEPDPDCDQPNNQCEAVGGTCIAGFVSACAADGLLPSPLSCGDHPIEMTCCAPEPDGCPDVCAAVCAGEPEPDLPDGCPVPMCEC